MTAESNEMRDAMSKEGQASRSAASDEASGKLWTISNIITLCRILLVPVFVVVLVCPWPEWMGLPTVSMDVKRYIAAGIFILISCTDWLDGYLARSRNEVTTFGKFMDPLADKILVAAALLVLIELGSLPSWVALIILAREFIVSGVRMIAASEGVVIAASYIGKSKTVFQMVGIVLFTIKDSHMAGGIGDIFGDSLWLISWGVMIVALVLTVISMLDYIVKAKDLLGFAPKGKPSSTVGVEDLDASRDDVTDAMASSFDDAILGLSRAVIEAASKKGRTVCTAESLTGGSIAAALTEIPGSSQVVRGGVISYVNDVKNEVLGVDGDVLAEEGAVCARVAEEMATGARLRLGSDLAVSVTGIAGPSGAEPGKPVGTVYMGVATPSAVFSRRFVFSGDRDDVRKQTVIEALKALHEELQA